VVVYLLDFGLIPSPNRNASGTRKYYQDPRQPFGEKMILKKFSGAYNPSDAVMNRGLARRE
jgi:hypothetical protein